MQAELFILRSSRDSGVLGLAGMAFTSQVFSSHAYFCKEDWKIHSVLLVRPLLDFSKEDMYMVSAMNVNDSCHCPNNLNYVIPVFDVLFYTIRISSKWFILFLFERYVKGVTWIGLKIQQIEVHYLLGIGFGFH